MPGNVKCKAAAATFSYNHSKTEVLDSVATQGYISFYDSGGYIQELGTSLEEGRAQLNYLQQHTWIDNM